MLPQTWYFNTYVSIAQEGGGVENIFPYIVTIVGIGCVLVLTLLLRMKSLRKNCDL
jgi:hypothetical protein